MLGIFKKKKKDISIHQDNKEDFETNEIAKKEKFDKKILRLNDISILIYDERWNKLFSGIAKLEEIEDCEKKLINLLKEDQDLQDEKEKITRSKKVNLKTIVEFSDSAYDEKNDEAKKKMDLCNSEVLRINKRLDEIAALIDEMPDRIKNVNIELLEVTADFVYDKIINNKNKMAELEDKIEKLRKDLKENINEKELLHEEYENMYSYFHNLLGPDEMEKLDIEFELEVKDESCKTKTDEPD